jgi:hypothetical protein
MKKKIGASKSMKKYEMAGTVTSGPDDPKAVAKKSFEKSKSPKLGFKMDVQTEEWDTSGFAGGKRKMFPMKITTKGKDPEYRTYPRKIVENQIEYSKDTRRPLNDKSYETGKQSSDRYNADKSLEKNKKGGTVGKPKMKTGGPVVKPKMKMGGMVKKTSKKK